MGELSNPRCIPAAIPQSARRLHADRELADGPSFFSWWGESRAKDYATKVNSWVAGVGIGNVVDGYTTSGSQTGEWQNSTFTGAFALTSIAISQERSDQFHADWLSALPLGADNTYFNASLRALYMLLAVGRFVPGCY